MFLHNFFIFQVSGNIKKKLSWRVVKKHIRKHLCLDQTPSYNFTFDEKCVTFDITWQLELLLCRYLDTIRNYRRDLEHDNSDILGGCGIGDTDIIVLHLHLSTDGGQLYRYKKSTVWPVHCMLLDLPLHLRTKRENVIILGLWESRVKPDWCHFLTDYLKTSGIGSPMDLNLGCSYIRVLPKLHTAVFDLPAAASILNHQQFNGKFGCLVHRAEW